MMYLNILICTIMIINLIISIYIILSKTSANESIKSNLINHNKDFLSKIDFLFNSLQNTKIDLQYQTNIALDPIHKTLDQIRSKTEEIERHRISRETNTQNLLNNLMKAQDVLYGATSNLEKETAKMINGFKRPHVRGKWGEVQLRRIADITGMLQYCEFEIQKSLNDIRPDMTIHLPNGGYIFVDSKAPLESYLQMLEDEDEDKFRKDNVKNIRVHVQSLSNKEYWKNHKSPELVVMFIPLEILWLYAIEEDPKLIEYAAEKNIVIATPMTLIGLLKSIYYGWSQVSITKDIEEIKQLLISSHDILEKNTDILLKNQKNLSKSISEMSGIHADLVNIQSKIASISSLKLHEELENLNNNTDNSKDNISKDFILIK